MFLFESSQDKNVRQDIQKQMQVCLRSSDQKNIDKYTKSMQKISKYIQMNNQKAIEKVVDQIKVTIKDDQYQPVRKYQAIKLLRDLMKIQIKNKNKNFGKYVVKKILKRLTVLASHKPYSNDQDRGKDLFKQIKSGQQKYSILFLNELLLAIEQWAKTWPGVSQGTKKQFNQTYKQLVTNGVQFPKQVVRVPVSQGQGYRKQDGNRNSVSQYNSLPKRDALKNNSSLQKPLKAQKPSISQQKPSKTPQKKQLSSPLIDQKQISKHFQQICSLLNVFVDILNGANSMDSDQWDLIQSILQELTHVVSKGDQFIVKLGIDNIQTNIYLNKIKQTFQFEKSVSKDIRKARKNNTQFPSFKNKYIILSNTLIKSLKEKQKATLQKPKLSVQIKKAAQIKQITGETPTQSAVRRVSVAKVQQKNAYSSNSGQINNWVIRNQQEFKSNQHKQDQKQSQSHQKFGSFGIGGIGEKIKKQNQTQKSNFARQKLTDRSNKGQEQKKITKKKVTIENQPIRQQKQSDQFIGFQKSGQNNQKSLQKVIDPQQNRKKTKVSKQKISNDSDQDQNQNQKKSNEGDQSSNFFGGFDAPKMKTHEQLGKVRQRGRRVQASKQAKSNNQFDNNLHSVTAISDNNLSAFTKEKSSLQASKNPFYDDTLQVDKDKSKVQRNQSFQLQPFDKNRSFGQKKSNVSGRSFDNDNPNFWDGQRKSTHENPFQDKTEINVTQRSQKSINPFEDTQFEKKSQKVQNPFQDNTSQLSKSSVKNFQMNKSFTKSDRSNPFQTTSQNLRRKAVKVQNPFQQSNTSFSKKSQIQNPFQTSKQEFKPASTKVYQAVSQQASFKKVGTKIQSNVKDLSIDNPFQSTTQKPQSINQKPESINQKPSESTSQKHKQERDSWKFSVKGHGQSIEAFDFQQFQNIPNRQSVQTSKFAIQGFGKNLQASNKGEQSIHFSHFGQPNQANEGTNSNAKKLDKDRSIHFSDFQNGQAQKQEEIFGFSAFQSNFDINKQSPQNRFSAFDVSRRSRDSQSIRKSNQMKLQKTQKTEDVKSRHSGFSGFNINIENKSETQSKNQSGVNWNQFQDFSQVPMANKPIQIANPISSRSEQTSRTITHTDPSTLKLNLGQNNSNHQSYNQSNYQSPQFNIVYESNSHIQASNPIAKDREQSLTLNIQDFQPIQKKGYQWNPCGINVKAYTQTIYNLTSNEIQQKKQQLYHYLKANQRQKQLLLTAKQSYYQVRELYLKKVQKLQEANSQIQSYKKILSCLKQANHQKQQQLYSINNNIQKLSEIKQKILQKQRVLFQKMKNQTQPISLNDDRKTNKYQVFNRNLKIIRQKELQITNSRFRNTYSRA